MSITRIQTLEVTMKELESILERSRREVLSEEDHQKLKAAVETLGFLVRELDQKDASVRHLRDLLFGTKTEKTENVFPQEKPGENAPEAEAGEESVCADEKKKRKGHGRNGADAYTGAEKIAVPHETLRPGDPCPKSRCKGKLYEQKKPGVLVRIVGEAPVQAKVYELQKLRCGLCGEMFTARPPDGVGEKKYDETSASMIGLLKYGSGLPFNRVQRLEGNLGIPLPAQTQWDIVHAASQLLDPAYKELVRLAAQGKVLHNDDTTMKILELMGKRRKKLFPAEAPGDRTGIFTSGIVSVDEDQRIALFFTGRRHAGENLETVLRQRASDLAAPIQMCDALAQNVAGDFETIVANCMAHGRRQFVDVAVNFPQECRFVLETLRDVYKNDDTAKKRAMSAEERMKFHREASWTLMKELRRWLKKQIREHLVEPNSGLGTAITYMLKHWKKLTMFLRKPGAPLDNNIAERVLKKAILHRKNALFYKTERGARVGDLFMSLIHTAELSGSNAFDYLTELQRNAKELKESPGEWMPWNYRQRLEPRADTRES